ncbi:MarR family winged helix-turn-helix transcriptional regulator [Blautia sp. HCP3S3_C4]|uniref:MarR family winged helix-turn-helix transcriptional regulator n=1 Tax=Blautia sp. HCP3S3_C4 TaxID=3438911 RepID=UPI003F8C1058
MWCPEEEKNEKEKREEKSMPALFMEINRQYGMRCMQRIREIGIQQGQMPIIMIVYRNNGCSQKEIAECMGVTPPTVNVSIQRLEKADIVCRRRDVKDQRIMRVYLTENGKKIVEEIQQESKAVEKVMFSNFSETELCLLRRFFGQILDNISEIPVNR